MTMDDIEVEVRERREQGYKVEFEMIHEVYVKMPLSLDRVSAAKKAIRWVREYMKTLPEGHRLRQACPQRHVTLGKDGRENGGHWLVKCICTRKSPEPLETGWNDLLDLDLAQMRRMARP